MSEPPIDDSHQARRGDWTDAESTADPRTGSANPFQSPVGIDQSAASFSLGGMLLALTLISVCMAVTWYLPGIGVLLFLLSAPALMRTWWIRNRQLARSQRMSIGDKILAFIASLAIVSLIGAASIGAFAAVCFPLGLLGFSFAYDGSEGWGWGFFIAAWILGISVGGLIAYYFIRWFWRLGVP